MGPLATSGLPAHIIGSTVGFNTLLIDISRLRLCRRRRRRVGMRPAMTAAQSGSCALLSLTRPVQVVPFMCHPEGCSHA